MKNTNQNVRGAAGVGNQEKASSNAYNLRGETANNDVAGGNEDEGYDDPDRVHRGDDIDQ